MLVLVFFTFIFFAGPVSTARVPICNGLRYTGTLISCDSGKPFYSYGFDFSISINPNNLTFPNQLRATNFVSWSSDPSSIYQAAPLMFSFNGGIMNQCTSAINETCLLDFPNGSTKMRYPLMVNGSVINYGSNAEVFINNGNMYDGYYGGLLSPAGNRLGWDDPYCPTQHQQSAVCTNFYYINVPEDNYGTCMNFKSTTNISDPARNTTITLSADYATIPTGFNVTVTNFTSSPPGFTYVYGPNTHYWVGGGGSTDNPVQTFPVGMSGPNWQITWTLDLGLSGSHGYGKVLAGELIKRNGIYYHDDSAPYTISVPCYKLTYVTPYYNNATAETKFCCTLFATN